MNQNVKNIAAIGAKSTLKWIAIFTFGVFISVMFFSIVLIQNIKFFGLINQNPAGLILLIATPFFIFLYFILANKITIQGVIYSIWVNKGHEFVEPLVEKIGTKITSKNNWTSEISNQAILKIKLISENANDIETPKMQRKILNYVIKKVNLDDIDFKDENLRLTDILVLKIKSFISTVSKPSYTILWVLATIQLLLFIVSQFYKNR